MRRGKKIRHAAIFVRDNVIEQVGTTNSLPASADEILDLKDRHVVLPGLVNTHHHFYQTLTRAIPAAQNCNLFQWLKTLYPIWSEAHRRGRLRQRADGRGGAHALGLHHFQRSPVPLSPTTAPWTMKSAPCAISACASMPAGAA